METKTLMEGEGESKSKSEREGGRERKVMVSLLTVNAGRGSFSLSSPLAAKFPKFFPVRLN